MKNLKIEVPQGYEIDKEKSTFENIVFKPLDKKLPLSVEEINDRNWYINSHGKISYYSKPPFGHQNVSTEKRAKAFLALMKLVELRDAWNGDWRTNWKTSKEIKYSIVLFSGKIIKIRSSLIHCPLCFKNSDIRDEFFETFKDLIEEAKELI